MKSLAQLWRRAQQLLGVKEKRGYMIYGYHWLERSSQKTQAFEKIESIKARDKTSQGSQVLFQSWEGVFRTVGFSGQWDLGSGHMTFGPCINQLITQMLYSGKAIYWKLKLSYQNIKMDHSVHSERRDDQRRGSNSAWQQEKIIKFGNTVAESRCSPENSHIPDPLKDLSDSLWRTMWTVTQLKYCKVLLLSIKQEIKTDSSSYLETKVVTEIVVVAIVVAHWKPGV